MKTDRIPILLILACLLLPVSCSYDKLPTKTGNGTTQYVLPKGEIPTAEDRAEVDAIRAEYDEYITNTTE